MPREIITIFMCSYMDLLEWNRNNNISPEEQNKRNSFLDKNWRRFFVSCANNTSVYEKVKNTR